MKVLFNLKPSKGLTLCLITIFMITAVSQAQEPTDEKEPVTIGTVMTNPQLFYAYLVISPSLVWDFERIERTPFLTEQQKGDIFYNNAARFLGLNEEEIAQHQDITTD